MSEQAPYQWGPCIVLDPQDIEDLVRALPKDSPLKTRLREAANEAVQLAMRLNGVERGKAA